MPTAFLVGNDRVHRFGRTRPSECYVNFYCEHLTSPNYRPLDPPCWSAKSSKFSSDFVMLATLDRNLRLTNELPLLLR